MGAEQTQLRFRSWEWKYKNRFHGLRHIQKPNAWEEAAAGTSTGVWYTVVGYRPTLEGHTCDDLLTTFNTQLSLFIGTCNKLVCSANGNDDTCKHQNSVGWPTEQNDIDYILVHGSGHNIGEFLLAIQGIYISPNKTDVALSSGDDNSSGSCSSHPIVGTTKVIEFISFALIVDSLGWFCWFLTCMPMQQMNDDIDCIFVYTCWRSKTTTNTLNVWKLWDQLACICQKLVGCICLKRNDYSLN